MPKRDREDAILASGNIKLFFMRYYFTIERPEFHPILPMVICRKVYFHIFLKNMPFGIYENALPRNKFMGNAFIGQKAVCRLLIFYVYPHSRVRRRFV
jgi:hypothetical protein